jgi:hypothetical protein
MVEPIPSVLRCTALHCTALHCTLVYNNYKNMAAFKLSALLSSVSKSVGGEQLSILSGRQVLLWGLGQMS